MWINEMDAIEKAAYGFVKLTKEEFVKLGFLTTGQTKCEACSTSTNALTRVKLSEKNRSEYKIIAILCPDCKENNSNGRSVPKGWEDS